MPPIRDAGYRQAAARIAGRRDLQVQESRRARIVLLPCPCNARSTLYESKSKTCGTFQDHTRSPVGCLINMAHTS